MKLAQETVQKLQQDPNCIRNVCIVAHVDHGKTSLSDSLLATNGIISQRLAGKVRYLDSREDEQLRGITMEASAISLYFKMGRRLPDSEQIVIKEYLINLIDSPGHIDFSSEVSTSSRLCDGAVVVVDVVEGVCSQTVNVLRQSWVDKLKPLLVINKIDRLISELQLTPIEAYHHISRVIEQVNSVIGSFYAGDRMEDDMIWREGGSKGDFVEKDDQDLYFAPEKNNVVFASAIDGWAFTINTFAKIYLAKLGFSHKVLSKTLWGDFYLDIKTKKIIPGKKLKSSQSSLKPLFVGLILDQIWSIYDNVLINRNQEKLEKIISKLDLKINNREIKSKDYKSLLNNVLSQWLPLSHALLGSIIDYLPSPVTAQNERSDKIINEGLFVDVEDQDKSTLLDPEFENAIKSCDYSQPDKFTLAYVSKLISIPEDELPRELNQSTLSADEILERSRKARELAKKASEAAVTASEVSKTEDEFTIVPQKDPFEWEFEEEDFELNPVEEESKPEVLVAFTRIFSGSLTKGQRVTVIGPKYDPSLSKEDPTNIEQIHREIEIKDIFLIMGRELIRMNTVPSGNIVGVVGIDAAILKNGTICSEMPDDKPYINLATTSTIIHNKPIMKVAIEPSNPLKFSKLQTGLEMLAKADPVLEWYIDEDSGELIVCVAGELHLERCLKDLELRFAKGVEVTIKEPVIPFREGIANESKKEFLTERMHDEEDKVEGIDLKFEIQPLPQEIIKYINNHEKDFSKLLNNKSDILESRSIIENRIREILTETGFLGGFPNIDSFIGNIIAFGPKRIGANIFIEAEGNNNKFRHLFNQTNQENRFIYETNVLNGFQLAMNEGPIASEPLQGCLVILKNSTITETETDGVDRNLGGRIIRLTKDSIHSQILSASPRLYLAMYVCEIQATAEVLGKVYAVVQQRGGTIISEEMKEGTPFFTIIARIPVIEAFGFSEDIRKKTSGAASPQLVFDGFDVLDIDPYWVPHTEEELEDLGVFAERENVARRYMNTIRRRKGLFVDEKVVQNAEKQRTMRKD
jgi:ribosome assembly protein 1